MGGWYHGKTEVADAVEYKRCGICGRTKEKYKSATYVIDDFLENIFLCKRCYHKEQMKRITVRTYNTD